MNILPIEFRVLGGMWCGDVVALNGSATSSASTAEICMPIADERNWGFLPVSGKVWGTGGGSGEFEGGTHYESVRAWVCTVGAEDAGACGWRLRSSWISCSSLLSSYKLYV
jgi:hypothetical protein